MDSFIMMWVYYRRKVLLMRQETAMVNGKIFIRMEKFRPKELILTTDGQAYGNSIQTAVKLNKQEIIITEDLTDFGNGTMITEI